MSGQEERQRHNFVVVFFFGEKKLQQESNVTAIDCKPARQTLYWLFNQVVPPGRLEIGEAVGPTKFVRANF